MYTFIFQWNPKHLACPVYIYYQSEDSISVQKPEAYLLLLFFEIKKILLHYTSTIKALPNSLQILKS